MFYDNSVKIVENIWSTFHQIILSIFLLSGIQKHQKI